jgi:hypothetical protein
MRMRPRIGIGIIISMQLKRMMPMSDFVFMLMPFYLDFILLSGRLCFAIK